MAFLLLLGASGLVPVPRAAAAEPAQTEPYFTQQDLFASGLDGVNIYRIPSLVVAANGDLLAFCEAREGDDGDPTDLVLKRSLYEARPVPPRMLNGYPRTFGYGVNWTRMQTVLAGEGQAIMQPCPVVDRETGRVMMCCQEIRGGLENLLKNEWHGRCLVLHSDDHGATWSTPREITESVGHFAAGPGVGIQLTSGRLVIPGYSKDGPRVIYSDDHGQSWRAGLPVGRKGANECQAVELADGQLMLSLRQGGRCRYLAFSSDAGESWHQELNEEALPDPGCQASLVRYPLSGTTGESLLLFSNPPHPGPFEARTDLTVRLSEDEGQSWPVARCVHQGPGAYSCLAPLPDGSIGLLYETGSAHPYEKISFARFNLAWLRASASESP
jgi:sialidase-1